MILISSRDTNLVAMKQPDFQDSTFPNAPLQFSIQNRWLLCNIYGTAVARGRMEVF